MEEYIKKVDPDYATNMNDEQYQKVRIPNQENQLANTPEKKKRMLLVDWIQGNDAENFDSVLRWLGSWPPFSTDLTEMEVIRSGKIVEDYKLLSEGDDGDSLWQTQLQVLHITVDLELLSDLPNLKLKYPPEKLRHLNQRADDEIEVLRSQPHLWRPLRGNGQTAKEINYMESWLKSQDNEELRKELVQSLNEANEALSSSVQISAISPDSVHAQHQEEGATSAIELPDASKQKQQQDHQNTYLPRNVGTVVTATTHPEDSSSLPSVSPSGSQTTAQPAAIKVPEVHLDDPTSASSSSGAYDQTGGSLHSPADYMHHQLATTVNMNIDGTGSTTSGDAGGTGTSGAQRRSSKTSRLSDGEPLKHTDEETSPPGSWPKQNVFAVPSSTPPPP
ncbi:unnamed protein product [Amoebophrya sp. A120]|nr:unnamed protein product [Amoebophrya sp. A120]|eukprot:GSA120T00018157001.1